jgi:hypothetical protein
MVKAELIATDRERYGTGRGVGGRRSVCEISLDEYPPCRKVLTSNVDMSYILETRISIGLGVVERR